MRVAHSTVSSRYLRGLPEQIMLGDNATLDIRQAQYRSFHQLHGFIYFEYVGTLLGGSSKTLLHHSRQQRPHRPADSGEQRPSPSRPSFKDSVNFGAIIVASKGSYRLPPGLVFASRRSNSTRGKR